MGIMHVILRLHVLLLCLCLLGTAPRDETATSVTGEAKRVFLRTWGEYLQTMRTLHMVFTQTKHLRVLRRPLVATGELWLKGETLRYILKNPAGETEVELRLDSEAIKTHYPQLRVLEVIELQNTGALPFSMPFLDRDPTKLEKEYKVELFVASGYHTLRLTPKASDSLLTELSLVLKDFQVQELRRVEKNGNRVMMKISAFTRNPKIRDTQLDLRVPVGTKVTYPLR